MLIAVVALLVAAGAGYWVFTRSSAPASSPLVNTAARPQAPNDSATDATESAAARAWNAAARDKAAPPAPDKDPAAPDTPPPPQSSDSIEEMVDRVMPAVVLIETTSGRGSGFFISRDTLITNVHVVQNDGYVTLRKYDGTTMNARVANKAPAVDIAVLKVAQPSANQVVIPMGSANALRPGQEIVVIGSALGTLQNSVSRGVVSAVRSAGGATVVQTDAAVNPGNSGGPMLDRNGAVIGITTMKYTNAEGLNFGVAIDHAKDLLEGRQMNLGTQNGLADIETQANARQSESERQQQQGEQQLRGRIGQLADAAATIDSGWKRFRDQCYQTAISGSYDREWFSMLAGTLPPNAGAGCGNLYGALQSETTRFRDVMRSTLADARRANVLPGTVRDILRRNRLDFEWDR